MQGNGGMSLRTYVDDIRLDRTGTADECAIALGEDFRRVRKELEGESRCRLQASKKRGDGVHGATQGRSGKAAWRRRGPGTGGNEGPRCIQRPGAG